MERKSPGDRKISVFHDLGVGSISSINSEFLLKTDHGYPTDAEDAIEPGKPWEFVSMFAREKAKERNRTPCTYA